MNVVHIYLDPEARAKTSPVPEKIIEIKSDVDFVRIPGGMASGQSSVAIAARSPDALVFIELSMANFECVAAAFRGAEERARECDGRN